MMFRRAWLGLVALLVGVPVIWSAADPAAAVCVPTSAASVPLTDVTAPGFVPVQPIRLADTRSGIGVEAGAIEAGCVLRVGVAAANPPAGATAVALTITSDAATAEGYVTAYACGSSRPETSTLNPRPNDPTSNLAVVALDSTRQLCFYSEQPTQLIVDVTGWFTPTGARLHEIVPVRSLDTRVDGTPAAAGEVVRIPLAGVDVPAEATAVAASVTITQATGPTYATAYPCGGDVPQTSTVNTLRNRDRGVPAIVGLGEGALCLVASASAHLIVDVTGWYGPNSSGSVGSALEFLATARVADTRNGIGTDGAKVRLEAGATLEIPVLDAAPVGSTAVQINVVAVGATQPGYLTVFPCLADQPYTSAVNFRAVTAETAMATVALGTDGKVCIFTSATTHVIVDLVASYGTPGSLHALTASPALDQTYRPGQLDHSLHCPAGGGDITITVDAPPGVLAAIGAGAAQNGRQTRVVHLDEGDATPILLSGAVDEHHSLRCLPADFPQLRASGEAATPGWYLASFLTSSTTPTPTS
ncbi:MAG: hypothetical protein R2705_02630 [Ilumatobacteraceae bacterium]